MKNNKILIIVTLIMIFAIISLATYAYFATGILNVSNVANLNVVTERNNMVFDTLGGEMSLNVTAANMSESLSGNVAAENNTTLTVNFTANTDYSMVCTYDIIYEWTSSDKYLAHTSGVSSNEFTIQASLANNAHVSEGTNSISSETDLSTLSYTNYSATVVSGAQIDGTGNTMSTAVWTLSSKFYNVSQDQSALSGKTYTGRFKVANVSCTAGTVTIPGPTSYWYAESTWDDNAMEYLPKYTYPNHGGTLQSSGTTTGHNVYIGQDNSKYYACGNDGVGHEVCLSQPYTQYGNIEGHVPCDDVYTCGFTNAQSTSMGQTLSQMFIDAGIIVDINNDCHADDIDAICYVGDFFCGVTISGKVYCSDFSTSVDCIVWPDGHANCQSEA